MSRYREDRDGPTSAYLRHRLVPMLPEENDAAFFASRVVRMQKAQLPKAPPRMHNKDVFEEPPQPSAVTAGTPVPLTRPPPPPLSDADIFEPP
jgi:hypothetical protein